MKKLSTRLLRLRFWLWGLLPRTDVPSEELYLNQYGLLCRRVGQQSSGYWLLQGPVRKFSNAGQMLIQQ